jgi:hypothetical protein
MHAASRFIGAVVLAATSTAAMADTSEILFRHKNWMVEDVTYDDGTVACLAEVSDPNDNFSIWIYPDKSISLQFFSTSWDFGTTDSNADLKLQVDRRADWSLTGATLHSSSVWFDLPNSDDSVNFLTEIASGSRLFLRNADGTDVMDYPLAGSSASMAALIDCGNVISSKSSNPFKS